MKPRAEISEKDSQMLRKAYEFADLSAYSFGQRLSIRVAGFIFYSLIRLIGKTIRFEIVGRENLDKISEWEKQPIRCFWHEQIFLTIYFFRRTQAVSIVSQSFDGEYIARCLQHFGGGVVRGSSTRGGAGALIEFIRLMKTGCSAFVTVDGPKGPRRVVKDGALLLSKKSGNPILPFSVISKKSRTLKSWDKMQIPRPFSRALILIGEPFSVTASANESEIEANRKRLQAALDRLSDKAEEWQRSEV